MKRWGKRDIASTEARDPWELRKGLKHFKFCLKGRRDRFKVF